LPAVLNRPQIEFIHAQMLRWRRLPQGIYQQFVQIRNANIERTHRLALPPLEKGD